MKLDLTWGELGELLSEELEDDPSINTLVYWLELAERQLIAVGAQNRLV